MSPKRYFIYVLGTAQDGGFPHLGCTDKCCEIAWENNNLHRFPTSIALIDKIKNKYWLFDATPRIKEQLHILDKYKLSGIFITHAHYGHYTGLLELGKEVLDSRNVPVYTMPRMFDFIMNNSPFNLLIHNKNILLHKITNTNISIDDDKVVDYFEVVHRNELSETVGYRILVNNKSIIYLPDLDNYEGFHSEIKNIIKNNDIIFLDGTFYNKKEIKNRNISKIPHPAIIESMALFSDLNTIEKKKIHFIHFNHTNPVININSNASKEVLNNGFSLSQEKQIITLC